MNVKILAIVLVVVAAFLLRTLWFDAFRTSQIRLEITGTVSVLEEPYPMSLGPNRVKATLQKGDRVKVVRAIMDTRFVAFKVALADGTKGYIIKGDSVVVR